MPGLSRKKTARPGPADGASRGAPPPPAPHPGPSRGRRPAVAALLLALILPVVPMAAAASPSSPSSPSASDASAAKSAPARPVKSGRPVPAKTAFRPPVAVIGAFDSLLQAGNLPAARALCTGQVLRMFDFLAMAHSRMAGAVDSARSTEDTLGDSAAGDWAWVKMRSHVVFKKPFLGQTEMKSVQAIHLWRSPRGWLIAEFQELEDARAPVQLRTGRPPDAGTDAAAVPGPARPGDSSARAAIPAFFPVSPKAPERPGEATWLRYRLRLRNGAPLAELCALDAYQRLAEAVSPSEWILENRRPAPASSRKAATSRAADLRRAAKTDTLRPWLASDNYLLLEDSLLQAAARKASKAAKGAKGTRDPARIAADVRAWVTQGFRFRLGAVLFGNSREVLRDMTGDCSEAAILAAAMLRASGVPARVVLGFASAGRGVFIGHAWTEAWLGEADGWVGVDAALGQYPAGVERVKLMHLGASDMRIAATNLMLAALSNIDIEILSARAGEKELPLVEFPGAADEGAAFFSEILNGFEKNEEVKMKSE